MNNAPLARTVSTGFRRPSKNATIPQQDIYNTTHGAPYDKAPYDKAPYDKAPYDKAPYDIPAYDRPPQKAPLGPGPGDRLYDRVKADKKAATHQTAAENHQVAPGHHHAISSHRQSAPYKQGARDWRSTNDGSPAYKSLRARDDELVFLAPDKFQSRSMNAHSLEADAGPGFVGDISSRSRLKKAAKGDRKRTKLPSVIQSADSVADPIGITGILLQYWMITWMFMFIPLGFLAYYLKFSALVVFTANFLAIVPLAWLMGKATEDCAASSGSIVGGLLNAWFGNIVEMLLCVAGLRQGSILSNLLLVTGCSLLFGGLKFKMQQFSAIGASTTASLLMLGTFCAGMPTMYSRLVADGDSEVLTMSRVVAVFLIALYFQFMLFQLKTHPFLYSDDDDEEADMSPTVAAITLGVCTVLCAFNSEFLISSISGVVASWSISKEFIAIILLPIIGNAAEHYTSVVVALNNKMDLSLGCAVGSSCQMLLFVTPVTVLAGMAFKQPMSLDLHAFEVMILIISVVIIMSILQDGYSNWLEGSILCTAYFVIATIFYCENPKMSDII